MWLPSGALILACSSDLKFIDPDEQMGTGTAMPGTSQGGTGGSTQGPGATGGSQAGATPAENGGASIPEGPPPSTPLDPGTPGQGGTTNVAGGMPDPTPTPPEPRCPDADGDGRCDPDDLCPNVANQNDGEDQDADGAPDACDPCPALADEDRSQDADRDGIPDVCDDCNGVAVALAKGPLYHYSFDEVRSSLLAQNRGSAPGQSAYIGTVELGLSGVADPARGAARFVGTSPFFPRLIASNATFPSTALTALFWVRTRQTTQYSIISYATADSPNEFGVFVDINLLRLNLEGLTFEQDLAAASRITNGTWHFVGVTWDGTVAQFYFDGEAAGPAMPTLFETAVTRFETPDPGEAIDLTSGGVLVLGQDQDSLNGGFATNQALDGGLDELSIFDRVLGADEIREIFESTTCGERCDRGDNDGDGRVDEGFLGSSPQCPAPSCQAILESGSAFGNGSYFLEADPNAPQACVFP